MGKSENGIERETRNHKRIDDRFAKENCQARERERKKGKGSRYLTHTHVNIDEEGAQESVSVRS